MSLLVPYVGADPREVASYKAALKRRQKERDESAHRTAIEQTVVTQAPSSLLVTRDFASFSKSIQATIIVRECAETFKISVEDIMGQRRFIRLTVPRQAAMYLVKKLTGVSWSRAGRLFGGRDHATIYCGFRRTVARMAADPYFAARIAEIEVKVLGASNAAKTKNV